ncbi:MAG: hypothetical protein ACYCZ2_18830 [Lutibacter sp.]
MSFLGKIFKRKKQAPAIKRAVAVSIKTNKPIVSPRVPISSNIKRNIVSPFFGDTNKSFLPLQLPEVKYTPTLTRAPYVPKPSTKSTLMPIKPLKTVVPTPKLDIIRPLVVPVKTTPIDKVFMPVETQSTKIVNEYQSLKSSNMLQKAKDFITKYSWKLLIPVVLIVGIFFYFKRRKPTVKRK